MNHLDSAAQKVETAEAVGPLHCVKCKSVRITKTASKISCLDCNTSFEKNKKTRFFEYFQEKQTQSRSLLEHQPQDFYTNEAFKTFTLQANSNALKGAIKKISPKYLVDVGCGGGGNAIELAGLFEMYIGFDPSSIPEGSVVRTELPQNVTLIRNDPTLSYPIQDNSVDLVALIASYDHIPDPKPVIQDIWTKLKPGGYLLINMTNYGYWLKTVLNKVLGREIYKHDDEHFCVHSPKSLIKDIQEFVPSAKVADVYADYRHIPNLPKIGKFVYSTPLITKIINKVCKLLIVDICRMKHTGADMIVVFRK